MTDERTEDYLSMYNDLLIAMASQLAEINKGIILLNEAVRQMAGMQPPRTSVIEQPAPSPAPFAPLGWKCPVHNLVKTVPAGISSRTGKAYDAFLACPEYGCKEKPPRIVVAPPPRAYPPSEMP